jgi:chemotaxis protein MotB
MKAVLEEKPDGAPEWMVSYADMITIIMSFFVIMFALASGEAQKGKNNRSPQQAAIDSLNHRFGPTWKPFESWGLMAGNSPLKAAGGKQKLKVVSPNEENGTVKVLKHEQARIRVSGRGQRVVIGGPVSFDDASRDLAEPQKARLQVIADELAGKPQEIEVVGYVSGRPLPPGSPYPNRSDLAFARCRHVVDLLHTMKIAPERIRIAVAQSAEPAAADHAATPPDDARVDVYLSDVLPERLRGE